MAADDQGLSLRGTAVEGDAFTGPGVIQVHGIAVLNRAVIHVDRPAGFFLILGDAGVDSFILQRLLLHFDLKPLVLAQGNVRTHKDLQMELQLLAGTDLVQGDFGLIHGMKVKFLHSRFIRFREQNLKCVIIEDAFPVQRLDHPPGRLASAEAGYIDAAPVFQECLLHGFIKLLGGNGKGQFRLVSGKLLIGMAHEYLSSCVLSQINTRRA